MVIRSQSVSDAALLHDYKARAIYETPLFILPGLYQLPRGFIKRNIYMD